MPRVNRAWTRYRGRLQRVPRNVQVWRAIQTLRRYRRNVARHRARRNYMLAYGRLRRYSRYPSAAAA